MSFRYTKKKIKIFLKIKIIVPLAYFPYLVKLLKQWSIILYSITFKVTNFLLLHNQVFYLVIHVLPNNSRLYMKFKQHLITIQLLMCEEYFLTHQKPLIKSGIVVFYSSYKLIGLKVSYLPCLKIIFVIVNKE